MLFLLFQLGNDRYALNSSHIMEIVPLVGVKHLPQAPPGVVGLLDYHGTPIPVLDLSALALNRPASWVLSTRIVVIRYPGEAEDSHLLGLLAERATETMRRDDGDFVSSGIANDGARYLGPVTNDARGVIQRIEVDQLLPAEIRALLFRQAAEIE